MGYRIEAQSPNEVENIRQRVSLQQQVGQLNKDVKKNAEITPHIRAIHSLLQKNLEGQMNLDEIYHLNQNSQQYIESKLNDLSFIMKDNIVDQTDLDEIYKYVKNTRSNVNKKLNSLKKQIEEQNEKMDKILELLEKDK